MLQIFAQASTAHAALYGSAAVSMSLPCRNLDAVSRVMACLQQDVLLNTDSHPAAGLMYHLADVFAVELREVSRAGPPPAVVLDALIEPFCQVMVRTQRAPFLARLR